MDTSYIITFIGDDRPGLVEQLSSVIESKGGNWLESRLSQLGGKFAGLILVSLPEEAGIELERALQDLASSGLSVRLTPSGASGNPAPGRDIVLSVLGPDRPGIVREVSRALAQRQINVLEMDSEVTSAPMSAEMIFSASIEARIPDATDMDDLSETLEDIANQMTLEIDIE